MKFMKWAGLVTSLLFGASLCSCWDYDDEDYKEMFSSNRDPFMEFRVSDGNTLAKVASFFGITGQAISATIDITSFGKGIVDIMDKLLSFVQNFLSQPTGEKDMLNLFHLITDRLDQIQAGIEGTHERITFLINGLPHTMRWEIAFNTIEGHIGSIDTLYQRFIFYQKNRNLLENDTLLNFAETIVSHDTNSIHSIMAKIHKMAAPSNKFLIKTHDSYASEDYQRVQTVNADRLRNFRRHSARLKQKGVSKRKPRDISSLRLSIFRKLLNVIENNDECSMKQTPQQLITSFYTMVSLVQARGYIMSAFAYTLLEHYNKGKFHLEKLLFDDLYNHYSKGTSREARKVLREASNIFRKCVPKKHVEGKTFEMITNFLQAYVENEVNLNNDESCTESCPVYEKAKVHSCYEPEIQLCARQSKCTGDIYDCRHYQDSGDVCLSYDPSRRYEWIVFDGLNFGYGHCNNKGIFFDSWHRWFVQCEYCVCICDDYNSGNTDRYISLRASMADTTGNKIVTGVRFVKKNSVMHIQIQDGRALPQGQVDQKSISWKNVEPFKFAGGYFEGFSYMGFFYNEVRDIYTLTRDARKIDLDQIHAPKDHVVTGLRFTILGGHVHLKMAVTPIDFKSGKLDKDSTRWVMDDRTRGRNELILNDPDDSRSASYNQLNGYDNMYMEFQPTSLVKDASQLTVPFFDAQPVSPMPATWLAGVELHHKGRSGYGGFLGFGIINYQLELLPVKPK